MPPKHPLPDILVSARPSYTSGQLLTPRTPHSRTARAEEGFTRVDLDGVQDDEPNDYRSHIQQQSQPLLSPGYRSHSDDRNPRTKSRSIAHWAQLAFKSLPLIGGSIVAIILFVLIAASLLHPGFMETVVLDTTNTPSSTVTTTNVTTEAGLESASSSTPTPTHVPSDPMPDTFISYENYTNFPLTGDEYLAECYKLMGGFMHHGEYWDSPRMGPSDVYHPERPAEYHLPEASVNKVCSSTITYKLDGHVGLVADLALMAQVAAFARERNRTFLIDDTQWNRGKWSDHFQNIRALNPGPEPGCLAPPPDELVACPRTARHWVISSRTAMFHLGDPFSNEYENPFGQHMNRLEPIYERARISFEEVIRPNGRNTALIRSARQEVASILSLPNQERSEISQSKPTPYIGVHIRRGDGKPSAIPFYHNMQVPLEKYALGAQQAWGRFYSNDSAGIGGPDEPHAESASAPDPHGSHSSVSPRMWVASDSPDAVLEYASAFPPAMSVFTLAKSTNEELRALAPAHGYRQTEFEEESLEERVRLTRGMVVDLAMVSGLWSWPGDVVPGAVVCGEGSNVCRVAALGFGFERAFGFDDGGDHQHGDPNPARARWVDVDVEGRILPAWHAFSLRSY